jgi:Zn-dependent peptidase ImmA (M78 family)
MPAIAVRRRIDEIKREDRKFSPRHLIFLAHAFQVSEEAMCRRLEGMHLLPANTWDSLKERGFSGATVRQVLGDDSKPEATIMPPRLWLLAADAYRSQLLTEGQLANLLKMDRVETRKMLDDLNVEENDGDESITLAS